MKDMKTKIYESVVDFKNQLSKWEEGEQLGAVFAQKLEDGDYTIDAFEKKLWTLAKKGWHNEMRHKIAFRCVMIKSSWYYDGIRWVFDLPATKDCMAVWKDCRKSIKKGRKLGVKYTYNDDFDGHGMIVTIGGGVRYVDETPKWDDDYEYDDWYDWDDWDDDYEEEDYDE